MAALKSNRMGFSVLMFAFTVSALTQYVSLADAQSAPRFLTPTGPTSASSVPELSRRGLHYDALRTAFEAGEPGNLAETLALAQSAWALGLVDTARQLWDDAMANRDFTGLDRARAALGRAIMELQEGEFERARALAERSAQDLPPSELRAQFWLVIAEALKEQGAVSLAETYYKKAVEEGKGAVKSEARFLLGECQLRLGRLNEARYTLAALETSSHYTPQALRRLAEIDHMQGNFAGVMTWIEEGRESFPSEFQDGWTVYQAVSALLQLNRTRDAVREVEKLRVQHSEGDTWLSLAEAALEGKYVEQLHTLPAKEMEEKE